MREDAMFAVDDILELQREQFRHDRRNHFDILSLHKNDRLKHYGLHYCKYVGRLARGVDEPKTVEQTIVDTALVCLSAANTLHQRLGSSVSEKSCRQDQIDPLRLFADAAGRFADACEKIDHVEEFIPQAREANADIFRWLVTFADSQQIDFRARIALRRKELAERPFYIPD
jgi:hypothetical protein